MVDDVKDIIETAESKASQEALDRARLARERREAEQRKRLDELRAHAAAAQAQREKRDEERRRRQAEQRARDDDRRLQVEERKRAIWEASISRREALLQREKDRTERLERQRAARSAPRPAFAFGSSTPRLLEPLDSAGFFWAARRAASTTNVMFASAPLTRRASALHLDSSDTDNKGVMFASLHESDRPAVVWCSVARRRTDLVPTAPARPGRAHSMTRLDRLPAAPVQHQPRTQSRSGDTTPGSRPSSALSTGVPRRAHSGRKPRPASIAGTGVNTPRGCVSELSPSLASTPGVSRDPSALSRDPPALSRDPPALSRDPPALSRDPPAPGPAAPREPEVTRRPASQRRPRPASLHASKPLTPVAPGEGKPPVHRKPKSAKDLDKSGRGKSPGRALSPAASKEPSVDKETTPKIVAEHDKSQVSAAEVTHKLEALRVTERHEKSIEPQEANINNDTKPEPQEPKLIDIVTEPAEEQKTVEKKEKEVKEVKKEEVKEVKREEKREKEPSIEKTDDSEMTASAIGRRITTEEQAKAALAERRRRAREELERQADLERIRLQREAEEEAERQRLEEERQRREEEEARELAALQRQMEEEKLRKAIEAQQQLEREESERKAREEIERQNRLLEEEEKRRSAEEAERVRKEEAEREEKERLARKQRVEAIMARTRRRKAEEDKKQQESKPAASETNNGNKDAHNTSQNEAASPDTLAAGDAQTNTNNGNGAHTHDMSQQNNGEDKIEQPPTKVIDTNSTPAPTNGNGHGDIGDDNNVEQEISHGNLVDIAQSNNVGHSAVSADFIQNEIASETQNKLADDFTTHNGHSTLNHPLTLQNAI